MARRREQVPCPGVKVHVKTGKGRREQVPCPGVKVHVRQQKGRAVGQNRDA